MEIEARVVAAALHFMQIISLEDTPPEDVLPLSLTDATSETQKQFLKDLAFQIVDTYVVNETNINALIEKLHKHKADVAVLPDGRFECRFPGCTKSFALDGKRRITHEKTHGLHSQAKVSTSTPIAKDDVCNYQLALLEYGMLFLNFSDAVSEADGLRILR